LDGRLPASFHALGDDKRTGRESTEHKEGHVRGRIGRSIAVAVAGLAMLATLAAVPAVAKDGDVIREGSCSGRSDWKLKLSPENGRIETEFEVDQNVNRQVWRVRIRHNGDLVFAANRTTGGRSGSFEVRLVQANRAGNDLFKARAVNVSTGEVCSGQAVFTR
jgi:hypothetical protein